jgi:hypothetical protein
VFCREIIAVYCENYTSQNAELSSGKAGDTCRSYYAANVIFHFGPGSALGTNTGTFISIWRVSLSGALKAESTSRPLEDVLKRKYSIKVSKGEKRGEMK